MTQEKVKCETDRAPAIAPDDSGIEHLKANAERLKIELDAALKEWHQALYARAAK